SLRTSTRNDSMQTARANARLALSMAIAQLQKHAGPDTRVTAPANLANGNLPAGVAGVWDSWRPPADGGDSHESKVRSNFRGYLVSDPAPSTSPDPSSFPSSGSATQVLVGKGTLGSTGTTN